MSKQGYELAPREISSDLVRKLGPQMLWVDY